MPGDNDKIGIPQGIGVTLIDALRAAAQKPPAAQSGSRRLFAFFTYRHMSVTSGKASIKLAAQGTRTGDIRSFALEITNLANGSARSAPTTWRYSTWQSKSRYARLDGVSCQRRTLQRATTADEKI